MRRYFIVKALYAMIGKMVRSRSADYSLIAIIAVLFFAA